MTHKMDDMNPTDGPVTTSKEDASGAARGSGEDPRKLRAYEAFLEQARWMADWQWRRGEAFEGKAGRILGFVGIILPLQTAVLRSVITVPNTTFAWLTAILFAFSALALVTTAVACVMVLKPRTYQSPMTTQVTEQWREYLARGRLSPEAVLGLFADQLLQGSGQHAPVEELRLDAKGRGKWMTIATWALFCSIAAVAIVVMIAAFHEAVQ
jgi:hypothetical protein